MVRVIPVGPGAIEHLKLVHVVLSLRNHEPGMTVHPLRNVQTVPVHDRGLWQLVREADANLLPGL